MYAWGPVIQKLRGGKSAVPSEELRVAVTFHRPDGGHGPTKSDVPLTLANVKEFVPEAKKMHQGIDELSKLGFKPTGRGRLTASMKCGRELFENVFKTKLEEFQLDIEENYAFHSFYFPTQYAPWTPILDQLIDDVYIQWPHMYMARVPSANPPDVNYFHLDMPEGVAFRLNATKLHENGMAGEGIRVVMIDTGFEHTSHHFFSANGYKSKVVLAGDAVDVKKDSVGHGTGQSANIFSLAPRAEFIGVKIGTDEFNDIWKMNPASMLEGFYKA